jgi:hypothetical protein
MDEGLARGIGGISVKDQSGNLYVLWSNRMWTREGEPSLVWDEQMHGWRLPTPADSL